MSTSTPLPPLINSLPATYGTKTDDHRLEQYKLYVESSQKLSDRRLSTNNYLFTLNSSLLTVLGLLLTLLSDRKPLVIIPLAAALLCVAWVLLLSSFKSLNRAKFVVIHELEAELPARVFEKEWQVLSPTYTPMSDLESYIPILFIIFYLLLAGFIWNMPPKDDKPQRVQIETPVRVELGNAAKPDVQTVVPPATLQQKGITK